MLSCDNNNESRGCHEVDKIHVDSAIEISVLVLANDDDDDGSGGGSSKK